MALMAQGPPTAKHFAIAQRCGGYFVLAHVVSC
jgi:hypothetical protein